MKGPIFAYGVAAGMAFMFLVAMAPDDAQTTATRPLVKQAAPMAVKPLDLPTTDTLRAFNAGAFWGAVSHSQFPEIDSAEWHVVHARAMFEKSERGVAR